jgi:hypothetical protein
MARMCGWPLRGARAAVLIFLALPAGCGYLESKKLLNRYGLEQNDVLLTGAEYRAIVATRVDKGDYRLGHVIPRNIRCAEPSPDIAKAISDALSTAIAAEVTKGAASGQIDVRLSRETSEAFAQLGERLATIQLLRDGLFRACEAYANGAIGAVNYGAILSAYDDLTVTLLAAEMTAGAFGRALAAASSTASGTAASQLLAQNQRRVGQLNGEIQRLKTAHTAEKDEPRKALLADEITKKEAERDGLVEENKTLATIAARERERGGTFVSPGGAIAAASLRDPSTVAKAIQEIHAKYLNNDGQRSRGALAMACINALSRVDGRVMQLDGNGKPTFLDGTVGGKLRTDFDLQGYTMFTKLCAHNMPTLIAGAGDDVRTRLTTIERRLGIIRREPPATPRSPTRTPPMQPKAETAAPEKAPVIVADDSVPIDALRRRTQGSLCSLLSSGLRNARASQAIAGACRSALAART